MKIWKPETSSDLARPSVDNQDTKPVVGPQDPVAPLSLSQTQHMNRGNSPVHSPVGRLRGDTECDTPGSPQGGEGKGELEARRELPHGAQKRSLEGRPCDPLPPLSPAGAQCWPRLGVRADGTQAQAGRRWAVRGLRVDANARRSVPGALRPGDHLPTRSGQPPPMSEGQGRRGPNGVT